MVKRNRKKRQSTHTKILHASKMLFEKKGVEKTTIDDVAAAAEIARSTFFTHFSSLDELYSELNSGELDDLLAVIKTAADGGAKPKEIVKALFYRLIDDTVKYPKTFVELLVKGLLFAPGKSRRFGEIKGKVDALLCSARGPGGDSPDCFTAIFGLYFGMVFTSLVGGDAITGEGAEGIKRFIGRYIENYTVVNSSLNHFIL